MNEEEDPEQFCFHVPVKDIYRTLNGKRLPQRLEPCGDLSLAAYKYIDDLVSEALGIPPAPR